MMDEKSPVTLYLGGENFIEGHTRALLSPDLESPYHIPPKEYLAGVLKVRPELFDAEAERTARLTAESWWKKLAERLATYKINDATVFRYRQACKMIVGGLMRRAMRNLREPDPENEVGNITVGEIVGTDDEKLYLADVSGESMIEIGINSGDRLIYRIPRETPPDGSLVLAKFAGNIFVKRLRIIGKNVILYSENPKYKAYFVRPDDDFEIVGEVVGSFKTFSNDTSSTRTLRRAYPDEFYEEIIIGRYSQNRLALIAVARERRNIENAEKFPEIYKR
ncbi:MAG: S24 family peptidase [Candidatus Kapabacteria bacterium]|nr:S24 family peptidase [Candidatus Kapabacteria bacterium]